MKRQEQIAWKLVSKDQFSKRTKQAETFEGGEQGEEETHLERRSRQDESVPRRVVLRERLRQLGLGVLHPVAFVDDHVHPLDLAEQRLLADDVLERRDDDLELA